MKDLFKAEKEFIRYAECYKIKPGTPTYEKCCNAFCIAFDRGRNIANIRSSGLQDKHGREGYEGDIFRVVQGRHYWLYEIRSFAKFGTNLYAVCYEHNVSDDGDEFDAVFTYEKVIVSDVRRNCISKVRNGTIIANISDSKEKPTGWQETVHETTGGK